MASIFDVEKRPKWQSERRTAVVAYLLSPKPSTLLKVMVAICAVWASIIAWAAISLVRLIAP